MAHWTRSDIPPQHGRTAVVTGTGGLGLHDALALAASGACVIIAGRNPSRGEAAVERIRQDVPDAQVRFELLDLADMASITAFAERLLRSLDSLELLINNAAVMAPPRRTTTIDGFELQFGTNYLGHFALTALLMPLLRRGAQARVVTLSSVAARDAVIDFDDLQSLHAYKPMSAYGQSKLACLMFALELQRRSVSGAWGVQSIAAHPGISRTDLLPNGAGPRSIPGLMRRFLWFLFQPAPQGALPTLFAATSPQAMGGAYYGPAGLGEIRGHPTEARIPVQAHGAATAARLWNTSEKLTGLSFTRQASQGATR